MCIKGKEGYLVFRGLFRDPDTVLFFRQTRFHKKATGEKKDLHFKRKLHFTK